MDNALPLQQGIQIRGVIRMVPRTIDADDGAVALVETAARVPRRLWSDVAWKGVKTNRLGIDPCSLRP